MFVLKLLIIIVLFALMIPISKDISETFANIDPVLFNDRNVKKFVQPNILDHSIKTTNKKIESQLNSALCRKTCLYDTIKYVEGTEWSSWQQVNDSNNYMLDITNQMYSETEQKLKSNIIYFKCNQYKKNLKNPKELLLNFEFVFYWENMPDACHATYVSAYNTCSGIFNILTVKILGTICEDKIHMYHNKPQSDLYVSYSCRNNCVNDGLVVENTFEEMTTHDEQVENILYDKLMASEEVSEDYWKNIEYTRNQDIVRNMFLKDKHTNAQQKDTNCYKRYPYKNDFVILHDKTKKVP